MNDKKTETSKQEWNSWVEPSSAITDSDLEELVGGAETFYELDTLNKVILYNIKNLDNLRNPTFRAAVEKQFSNDIANGYIIVYTNTDWGYQLREKNSFSIEKIKQRLNIPERA